MVGSVCGDCLFTARTRGSFCCLSSSQRPHLLALHLQSLLSNSLSLFLFLEPFPIILQLQVSATKWSHLTASRGCWVKVSRAIVIRHPKLTRPSLDGIHVDMQHLKSGEVKYVEISHCIIPMLLGHPCANLFSSLGTSM